MRLRIQIYESKQIPKCQNFLSIRMISSDHSRIGKFIKKGMIFMAETVNTSALLLSDGQGGYSKAFMESMTDIVKLQNGSSLTEKLAEIDGKRRV